MAMQDFRVSKAPLRRQPAVWAAGTVALVVVSGLGRRMFSAEALDKQPDRRAGADRGRLAEFEQVYRDSATAGVRRREPQRGGNSFSHSGEVDEASSTALPSAAEAKMSAAPSDAESAECADADSFPKSPVPVAVASQEPPSQSATETAPAAESPQADSPKLHDSQTTEAAATGSPPAEPSTSRSPDWLKCNEHGEPYEVTLADGTVLKLETYGDEYEGYDYRPPMRAEKAEVLVDYKRLHRDGVYGGEIHLDVKRKKIYWGDTPGGSHPSSIRRANLNGSHIETVVDRNPLRPSTFVLDSVGNKIYWVNSGRTNGEGRSIQCANLDGSRAETVVQRIAVPSGIAVDPVDRKLFYFDDNNLICSGLDGADERRLLIDSAPGTLLIDHDAAKIYWTTNMHMIRRADSDGANIGDAVNVGEFHGHIKHVAIDHKQGKLYWTEENAGHIRRANLDGSQVEDIVVGISGPTGVDVDSERGHLYWIETFPDRGIPNVRVRRATVPPLLTPVKKRAPPLVTQVEPSKQRPGGMMTLTGDHFESLKKVAFVDDSTGKEVKARFTVSSEHALSVTVPQLSKGCRHPIIVLQSDSGVTVVIPRTARVAHRESIDRFHSEDECTFVVPPGAMLKTERGVAFAQNRGEVYSGPFGQNTFFLKNGAMSGAKKHPNNLIYFEPFALISEIDKPAKGDVLIPCPAIRASVIGSSITYEKME